MKIGALHVLLTILGAGLVVACEPSQSSRAEESASAAHGERAEATLRDPGGKAVGKARLRDTPSGVLIDLRIEGLPAGEHALHLHGVGSCAPSFAAAGGHFDPAGRAHGFLDPAGPHAGDLPNVVVPTSGELRVEVLAHRVRLGTDADSDLLDDDGSAIVIHAGPDDYRTDPAGDAGTRIACGPILGVSP